MTTRINYSSLTTFPTGKTLAETVNLVFEAVQGMARMKALLDSASSGSDWRSVGGEVGLPASAPGDTDAQNLWTIVSNASAALNAGAISELARLDKGGHSWRIG